MDSSAAPSEILIILQKIIIISAYLIPFFLLYKKFELFYKKLEVYKLRKIRIIGGWIIGSWT